ncbi:unnamed protein product [Miscanthus lutarioriparius]|uniref:Uncharacterized protein n=1 Tax=Miscanthus lutarioriparius TaxID=422564 RepID=A0A811N498_9POAL|nr:unnamed protein product [Miscanthus lutarioriparius]
MASQAIEGRRARAQVVTGDAACRKKSIELLEELGLPKGLLPMEDIQEFGYNRETGFMWLVQGKKKVEHTFKKIKQTVSYAAEVTAFVEKGKLRNIIGVKTKELMLWLSVVEVYVPEASPEKVTFKTGTGLSDTFEATAFALGQ